MAGDRPLPISAVGQVQQQEYLTDRRSTHQQPEDSDLDDLKQLAHWGDGLIVTLPGSYGRAVLGPRGISFGFGVTSIGPGESEDAVVARLGPKPMRWVFLRGAYPPTGPELNPGILVVFDNNSSGTE